MSALNIPAHWRVSGPENAALTLLLAPGSGSLMDSDFMEWLAAAFSPSIRVVRFEFPFQQWMRANGRPRPPDRLPGLVAFYQQQLELVLHFWPNTLLWLGGKSLGGRVAVHLLTSTPLAQGALVFGYPFHPPAKPQQLRTAILQQLNNKPLWIAQGTRDPFGTWQQVADYGLPAGIYLHWVEGGNHDLRVARQKQPDWQQTITNLTQAAYRFMTSQHEA